MSERPATPIVTRPVPWRTRGPIDPAVVVVYCVLILVFLLLGRTLTASAIPDVEFVLAVLIALFLARYVSTRYEMDGEWLRARRLFGSRSIELSSIRRIERANLRDLSPVGMFRGWGWRGRVWSPRIGTFDSIHTVSAGVLVYAEGPPLFLSPKDPAGFVRELDRRVRSSSPDLDITAPTVA